MSQKLAVVVNNARGFLTILKNEGFVDRVSDEILDSNNDLLVGGTMCFDVYGSGHDTLPVRCGTSQLWCHRNKELLTLEQSVHRRRSYRRP
ncbi:hypothetical protein D3C79_807030 [compost metagenome]